MDGTLFRLSYAIATENGGSGRSGASAACKLGNDPAPPPVILIDADQSYALDMTSRSHGWRDEGTNSRLTANDHSGRSKRAANGQKQSLKGI
ncbi:protein of unknown function [Pseudomonas sp. JV241A]|nr:protein of unknown function [Pseudomonas sp. JV241A]